MQADEHWDLWRRDPSATPFQSPAWIEAWWQHLGGGERIDAKARDDSGRLIGLLPLFIWQDGETARLVPLGAGHSDYCDALIDPAHRKDASAKLFGAIESASWDEVLLPDLRRGSALLDRAPAEWIVRDEPCETCPMLRLSGPLGDILPARQRRKLSMAQNRAERLGGVSVRLVDASEAADMLGPLFALHADRWEAEGEPGVLADPRIQRFHRAAVPALAAAGLLRLVAVAWKGRIVAVLYALADRVRWNGYIIGVDMSVPKQSFGMLALGHLLECAIAEGATEFHFLRGDESYKFAWGAEPRTTMQRVIRRHHPHPKPSPITGADEKRRRTSP